MSRGGTQEIPIWGRALDRLTCDTRACDRLRKAYIFQWPIDLTAMSAGWRRGGDSNPRWACTHAAFRVRYNQPLCHLSLVPKSGGRPPGGWRCSRRGRRDRQAPDDEIQPPAHRDAAKSAPHTPSGSPCGDARHESGRQMQEEAARSGHKDHRPIRSNAPRGGTSRTAGARQNRGDGLPSPASRLNPSPPWLWSPSRPCPSSPPACGW